MRLDRRHFLSCASVAALAGCVSGAMPEPQTAGSSLLVDLGRGPDLVIPLWPDGAPGGEAVFLNQHYVHRDNAFGLTDRALLEITDPTLSLFRAARPNGAAILLIPGGGYSHVVVEKEGFEGARYFSRFGYDVYVMSYRLPHQGWAAGPDTPLQDAQRAMRLVRSRATPEAHAADRIMVMGFSAGGHLAGSLCQRFDTATYAPVDDADALSARPDRGVLVYPVALMPAPFAHEGSRIRLIGETPDEADWRKYDLSTAPNPAGPPVFLLHALDDEAVPVENSLQLGAAYRRAGVEAVIHTFRKGGHGFGLRGIEGTPAGVWPQLVMQWDAGLDVSP